MSDIITPSAAKSAEDLVALIDQLMAHGSGHINIASSDDSQEITVQTVRSTDCSGGQHACCQPTETGIDPDED